MNGKARTAVAPGILVSLLAVLGLWTSHKLGQARTEFVAVHAQLVGLRDLLGERGDERGSRTQVQMPGTEAFRSAGAAVQKAAAESGLGSGTIREVSPADTASTGAYRVRVAEARVEGLVKFIHLLGESGLQAVELEMDRREGPGGRWSASLLLARTG